MEMLRNWCLCMGFGLFFGIHVSVGWCAQGEPQIVVQEGWGQPLPAVAPHGVFYMIIDNRGDVADTLRSAHSPACGSLELHEWYQKPGGAMGMGAMGMRLVPGGTIEIPPGSRVELKADGLHLMCLQKRGSFEAGTQLPLTLQFEKAGAIPLQITIRQQ